MRRGLVILALITSICSGLVWAEDKTSQPAQWVVGARPFTLNSSRWQNKDSLTKLTESLPSIILENLADAGVRVLMPEEILERQLVVLYKDRTSIARSLESTIKERDQQIFLSPKERTVESNLKEKEKKIEELKKQLEEKDEEIVEVKKKLELKDFLDMDRQQESLTLWKESSSSLFDGETVRKENINGLLTGEITASGNYISVKVNFTIYPGEIPGIEITSAASLADSTLMAQEIANQLKPVVQNRPIVRVDFDISPQEALDKTRIIVDGEVFFAQRFEDTKIIMAEGRHSIEVEALGYRTKTFTGDFSGSNEFLAKISLEEIKYQDVKIDSKKYSDAQVYINGIPEGTLNESIEVPTGLVFGTVYPTPLPKYSKEELEEKKDTKDSNLEEGSEGTLNTKDSTEEKSQELAAETETAIEDIVEESLPEEKNEDEKGITEDKKNIDEGDVTEEKSTEENIEADAREEKDTEENTEVENSLTEDKAPEGVGNPYYFVAEIDSDSPLIQLNLRLKRDSKAISDVIEKRRRAMYNSYSALIISLIPTFVSHGIYANMHNSWALGHGTEKTAQMWKNISTGSMILSAGLGVNFAVQLGLFIGAADGVLPERAKNR